MLGLTFGVILFVVLATPMGWGPINFSPEGAGGFLQGVWGTAGSLAAAFVAIVLANQALILTKQQNEGQQKQADDTKLLQKEQNRMQKVQNDNQQKQADYTKLLRKEQIRMQQEQNHILQQNTPEYQIAYRAAMSSTKLDSLQIIIGSLERKKFRGKETTTTDALKSTEPTGNEFEVKREIKGELLGSRYIEFVADIAEKMYGTNNRLEIETLMSELMISSRLTLDKILTNRLNKTVHLLINRCMEDIQKTLLSAAVNRIEGPEFNAVPDIFRFVEYEQVKKSNGFENTGISQSAYYFVHVLFAQMRRGEYIYAEEQSIKNNLREKMQKSEVSIDNIAQIPKEVKSFHQGFCVVTPFDFYRQTLLIDLEFPDRNDISFRNNLREIYRGQPDLEIMCAINHNEYGKNPIIFLDQVESAKDSIQKNMWLTFSEHLTLWEGMNQLNRLFDATPPNLGSVINNFIKYVKVNDDLNLSENESIYLRLEKILPRYREVSQHKIDTDLGRMSNYDFIFLQAECKIQPQTYEAGKLTSGLLYGLEEFMGCLLEVLKLDESISIPPEHVVSVSELLKKYQDVKGLVHELAKRPFFERPIYGWIIPDYGFTCSLETAASKPVGFVGMYYLQESGDDFILKPNSLYNWLTAQNLQQGPGVRSSVAIAI